MLNIYEASFESIGNAPEDWDEGRYHHWSDTESRLHFQAIQLRTQPDKVRAQLGSVFCHKRFSAGARRKPTTGLGAKDMPIIRLM